MPNLLVKSFLAELPSVFSKLAAQPGVLTPFTNAVTHATRQGVRRVGGKLGRIALVGTALGLPAYLAYKVTSWPEHEPDAVRQASLVRHRTMSQGQPLVNQLPPR